MKQKRFIISGGGTGGHIYPAIAIANELKIRFPEAEILFVGAKDKMEMQKVPQAGYAIEGLWIAGLQRKLTVQNILFPIKLLFSLIKSYQIVKKFKPDVVIGTGGFASGPLLKMASVIGVPTVIQEQNSFPGITNKLLSASAKKICVAYEGLERFFPKEKIVVTGNPVRQDLIDVAGKRDEAVQYLGLDTTRKTLLVIGGSLGARRINELLSNNLRELVSNDLQVIWQCGKFYESEYKYLSNEAHVQVMAFIERMDLVYAAADIIVSRAGASSVSELCLVGKPVIFIPSPNVSEDHQTKNAQAIVDKGAAIMVKESDLSVQFMPIIKELLQDQTKVDLLSKNAKKNAKVRATKDIVDEIINIL